VKVAGLKPRRHEPPAGWPPEVFERVTDSLAAALVAAHRRAAKENNEAVRRKHEHLGDVSGCSSCVVNL
jgi:hypothetical protein